jgi:hypothetical protein
MNRKEAEKLVGQPVSAWTAMNGVYVGPLISIFGSPWRGRVAITGVVQPAAIELSRGDRQRRGFRPGGEIEVGGSSIQPVEAGFTGYATYLDALVASEASLRESLQHPAAASDRNRGTLERVLEHRQRQVAAERAPRHANSPGASVPCRLPPNIPMNDVWKQAPAMLATLNTRQVQLLDWLATGGEIFGGTRTPNIMMQQSGKKLAIGPLPEGDILRILARSGWVRFASGAEPDFGNYWLTDAAKKVWQAKNRKTVPAGP